MKDNTLNYLILALIIFFSGMDTYNERAADKAAVDAIVGDGVAQLDE